MKILITEFAENTGISMNELFVALQELPEEMKSGVGRRTWLTEEGVDALKKRFDTGSGGGDVVKVRIIGPCPNPRFYFVVPAGLNKRVAMRIPNKLKGKLNAGSCYAKVGDPVYEWAKG